MWIRNRCCGLSQSQKVTRDRRHTLPSKSIRIRAGMMSISVPTNPTIAPTCNDAVSIHPHQKPIPIKNPSPPQETPHPKPSIHQTIINQTYETDPA